MSEISQELAARMAAFVRDWVANDPYPSALLTEARAIVALLPKPVDPDLEEAKAIAFKNGWGRVSDDSGIVIVLLKALRRGRELSRTQSGEQ